MNTFGYNFRITVFGESHGECVGVILDGVPPGILLKVSDFWENLERRKGTNIKGTTPRKEEDIPIIKTGIFNEYTTGAPLTILFENKNIRSEDYEKQRAIPRPGHADFAAHHKFNGYEDFRGSGHFSARLTVGIVAAGVVAQKVITFLNKNININASVISIAGEDNLDKGLQKAIDLKDSVGGIIECNVQGLAIGIGEPFWDSMESMLAHAMFAIPAVKGIEFGAGFKAATMFGSEHNDSIIDKNGKTATNHSGGINGGLSNGNDIVFRIVLKPTSSTPKLQRSFNTDSGEIEDFSVKGRHDLCVALRAPVIVEAMTAIVLANFLIK